MSISLKTNVAALTAQAHLSNTTLEISRSLAKLSSGYRITRAQDDPAGLAISVNLGAQIRSYHQAVCSGVSDVERGFIQHEVGALISEVDRIANATEYNGVSLINGTTYLTFQVGIRNVAANDQIVVTTSSATA